MTKKHFSVLKAAISCSLLVYLFISIDMPAFKSVFGRANWPLVVVSFFILIIGFCISCYKWQSLLKSDEVLCSFGSLARYYLIGFYFNNFLPTSIGGDAMRIFLVSRECGKQTAGFNSVLAERFSGLIAVIVLGLLGMWLTPVVAGEGGTILFSVALGVSMLAIGTLISSRFRLLAKRIVPAVFWRRTEEVLAGTGKYFRSASTLWLMTWTSLLFQALIVLVYFLGAKALDLTITFSSLMAVVPIVTLLMLIPISLNGLGIREGGFVVLLSRLGVAQPEALSLSLLIYGLTLLFSFAGGIVFFVEHRRR